MPRLVRAVAVGFAHHITQRGNNRQDVFFVDDDRGFIRDVFLFLRLKKREIIGFTILNSSRCLRPKATQWVAGRMGNSVAHAVNVT